MKCQNVETALINLTNSNLSFDEAIRSKASKSYYHWAMF